MATFRGAYPLSYLVNDEGKWCYYTGGFATREEADSVQDVLRRHGFVRPEVVVWTDGEYRNLSREPEDRAVAERLAEALRQADAALEIKVAEVAE